MTGSASGPDRRYDQPDQQSGARRRPQHQLPARSMVNNFLPDGIDNNAYGESNQGFDNQIIAVPPDSVAQFQVVTNNESAEYGRASGATINVASSSGTNRFHATVYGVIIRNTDLNAAGLLQTDHQTAAPEMSFPFRNPPSIGNQFGVNFGGVTYSQGQAFLLRRLRRLPSNAQAAQRLHVAGPRTSSTACSSFQ